MNIQTIIDNISLVTPNMIHLAVAFSYTVGIFTVIISICGLRNISPMANHQQGQYSLYDRLKNLLLGILLIYLPSTVTAGSKTLFTGYNSPIAYAIPTTISFYNDVLQVMALVGIIAVIRAIQTFKSHSEGSFYKGMSHFVGGVLLLNFDLFKTILFNTIGLLQ